jgi:hypothetical protein
MQRKHEYRPAYRYEPKNQELEQLLAGLSIGVAEDYTGCESVGEE